MNTPSTRGSQAELSDVLANIVGVVLIAADSVSHETVRRQARVSLAVLHPT